MAQIGVKELIFPLCVIDKSAECAKDPDFMLTVDDILAWEAEYGRIPEGAFVAFRSDWYVKPNLDNPDENGQPHYPGWDVNAIRWLVEERNIGAIGHEPADTDPAKVTTKPDAYPYPGEQYILSVDRFQIEVMRNLDQCPPTGALIVCSFPTPPRRRRLPRPLLRHLPQRLAECLGSQCVTYVSYRRNKPLGNHAGRLFPALWGCL